MPAQVGALDALVLLVAILVGLALGALVAWASLLLRTGHVARPMPGERTDAAPPAVQGTDPYRPALEIPITLLSLAMLMAIMIWMVPSTVPWMDLGDGSPQVRIIISAIFVGVSLLCAFNARKEVPM